MRIISGKYKGRNIEGFDIDGTRPTMDRVKESIVAMIQNKLKNSICLDLFCGSGSVGLEFISNGAKSIYFVDNNPKVIELLKKTISKIKIEEETNLICIDYKKILKIFSEKNIKFDIIFLDPPYKTKHLNKCLKLIDELNLLKEKGIVILEYENEFLNLENYLIIKERKYGSKSVKIVEKYSEKC